MNELVTPDLTTTSEIIAKNTGREHKDVLALIEKHHDDLKEVGQVTFETRAGYQGSIVGFAVMDDYATMLLLTHMRSIGVVKDFKRELIIEFKRMRDYIRNNQVNALQRYSAQIAEQSAQLAIVNQREPRDEKTLAVIMNCPTRNVVRHFDILVRNGYLNRKELPPVTRYTYEATHQIGALCIGKKGDSLLFDDKVKDLIGLLNQTESLFD
jgi:phage regulator Rha-like protein